MRLLALLTSATASLALAQSSHAQTWLNPNTGSWNVGGNWVGGAAPVSSTGTQLTFNATGVQSYSASNNIVSPFTLNRMTFGNSGSGLITITGQSIQFGGATQGFVQNGSGPVTLTNAITLPTTGSTIDTTSITGSGAGAINLNGALTSAFAPSFTNGAALRNDNPNATINVGGGGNLFGLSANQGSITVTAGTQTNIVAAAGVTAASFGTLTVTGPTAQITTTELDGGMAAGSRGNITTSNGGKIVVNSGNAFIASAQSIAGDFLGSFSTTTVTGTNSSIAINGNGFPDSTGILFFALGAAGVTSGGTLNISAGGQVSTMEAFLGERDGVATINVSGAGSQFTTTDQVVMESTTASRFNISTGGKMTVGGSIYTSSNPTDNALITISGTNSLADWSASHDAVLSGGLGIPAGNTTISISAGGELRANKLFAAENENGRADILVDGTNSKLTLVGTAATNFNQLVMGHDLNTTSTLTVTNGGRVTVGTNGAVFMALDAAATATATFNGTNTLFDASAPGAQLLVGGSGAVAEGTALFSVTNNAVANVNNLTTVYTRGTINIGSGTSPGTFVSGQTAVNGTVNFNAGAFNTPGALSIGGQVLLSSAARLASGAPTNKKLLEAGALSLTGSGVLDLNDNDALLHSTSLVSVQNAIRTARNGGAWNLPGITSTAAKNSLPKNKGLGAITGAEFHTAQGAGATFNSRAVANSDVLIKFTFYGDTDLNGIVDFDDYSRTDNGFNNTRTGWFNGDFDYNGVIDFDDYSLIDQAFNTQGSVVLSMVDASLAGPGDRQIIGVDLSNLSPAEALSASRMRRAVGVVQMDFDGGNGEVGAGVRAVPEPSALAGFAVGLSLLARRRRRAV
ncbi:MAG: PEP-CTERM sorting domain-containing protein [Anaerolineae bacterium]|nr:PEP-CTERM sorting domain-containing protein [Phycisphaerae bacterium]